MRNVFYKIVIIIEKRDHIAGNIYSHEDPYRGLNITNMEHIFFTQVMKLFGNI